MTELETLERNIKTLLNRFSSLQDDNFALREENERQRQEIMRSHAELVKLQSEHRNLLIAKGLTGNPEEQIKRGRLNPPSYHLKEGRYFFWLPYFLTL